LVEIDIIKEYVTGGGLVQAQHQPPNSGFTRTAFPRQTEYLTLPDGEVDIIDGMYGWNVTFIEQHG
jgi:hypothetical protein